MKNILLFFLFVVGVVNHGEGKNVRLHGSLKEFGKSVVIMDFDGADGVRGYGRHLGSVFGRIGAEPSHTACVTVDESSGVCG